MGLDGVGWNWETKRSIGDLEAAGATLTGVRFVVARHPQGRREGRLVRSIIEAFDPPATIDSNAELT